MSMTCKITTRWFGQFLSLAVAIAAGPAIAESSPSFRSFEATYVGRVSGAKVEINASLRQQGTRETYLFRRSSEPRGFAKLFRRHGVYECATIDTAGHFFQPTLYDYLDGKGGGKSSRIEFDWETRKARSTYEGNHVTLDLTENPLDLLSEELLVRSLLARGIGVEQLPVIQRNAIHTISYESLGEERITVPVGTFDTVHLRRRRGTSSRTTDYWYARELDWLPVKIERRRKGKSQGDATLKALAWLEHSGADDQVRGNVTPVCP